MSLHDKIYNVHSLHNISEIFLSIDQNALFMESSFKNQSSKEYYFGKHTIQWLFKPDQKKQKIDSVPTPVIVEPTKLNCIVTK